MAEDVPSARSGARKEEDTEVVERAVLGGCAKWRTLKSGERRCTGWHHKPVLGVHYTGQAIREWTKFQEKKLAGQACTVATDEGSADAALADYHIPAERLRTARREPNLLPGFE